MSSINHSYIFYAGELYNWNNSYYFTYFAEFDREWPSIAIVEVFFLCFLFVLAFAGNVTIIWIVVKHKTMKTVTNYFLCNLAVASVLFTSAGPFIAVIRITEIWVLGNMMCHVLVYVEFVGGFVSIWTMTFISIDRFRRTVEYTKKRLAMRTCLSMIVALWILTCTCFIPIAVYFVVVELPLRNTTVTVCTLIWPNVKGVRVSLAFVIPVALAGFVLPLFIMGHNYFRVLRVFWLSKHNLQQHRRSKRNSTEPSRDIPKNTSGILDLIRTDKKAYNIVKTLVLIVVLFFLMWAPLFTIFGLVVMEANTGETTLRSSTFLTTLTLTHANAVLNPMLYCFFNDKLRKYFADIWLGMPCCVKCMCPEIKGIKQETPGVVTDDGQNGNGETSRKHRQDCPKSNTLALVKVKSIEVSNFSNFNNPT